MTKTFQQAAVSFIKNFYLHEVLAAPLKYVHSLSTNRVEGLHALEHVYASKRLRLKRSYAIRASIGIGVKELGREVHPLFLDIHKRMIFLLMLRNRLCTG